MPRRRGNHGRKFKLDLMKEFEDVVEDGMQELAGEVAEVVFDVAAGKTRERTGKLKANWGISVGPKPDFSRTGKSAISEIEAFDKVFVHNRDFRASFHEHGTEKMTPQPMLRPGIEAAKRIEK